MSGRGRSRQGGANVGAYDAPNERRTTRRTVVIVTAVVVTLALVALVTVIVVRQSSAAAAAAKAAALELPPKASPKAKDRVATTPAANHGRHDTQPASKPTTTKPAGNTNNNNNNNKPGSTQTAAAKPSKPAPVPPPPATCPANSVYAPTVAPVTKCTAGRATLAFCPMDFGTVPLTCVQENQWQVLKTPVGTGYSNVSVCNYIDAPNAGSIQPEIQFTITSTVAVSDTLLRGSGHVRIVNGGNCTTNLLSLLLLLERSGIASGTGNSVGPGGQNHQLLSTIGQESTRVTNGCGADGVAQICDTNSSIPCNTSVPYEAAGILGNLALATTSIAPTTCTAPVVIPVDFVFPLDAADLATLAADGTGYRINVLATFDTCCDRGSACGIDIDCDARVDNVRTVQVRSPSFNVSTANCQRRCGCLPPLKDDTLTQSTGTYCDPSRVAMSTNITGICTNNVTTITFKNQFGSTHYCCNNVTEFGCNNWNNAVQNRISIPGSHPDCTSLITGESLVTIIADNATTAVSCECNEKKCPSPMRLGDQCYLDNLCGGWANCSAGCAALGNTSCATNTCECLEQCDTGDVGDSCGNLTFCGETQNCECKPDLECRDGTCQAPCFEDCPTGAEGDSCGPTQLCNGVNTTCNCRNQLACKEGICKPCGPCDGDCDCPFNAGCCTDNTICNSTSHKCEAPLCDKKNCDDYECIPNDNRVIEDCYGICATNPCTAPCTECSLEGRCVPIPDCIPPAPYCTWTRGAWTQTCTPESAIKTCSGSALVNPSSTKPACVDASCYADSCADYSDTAFFRLGNAWPNGSGAYIDFNPCLVGTTVARYGDLYTLVESFVDIHDGPSSYLNASLIPVDHLWHSVPPADTATGMGTLGAQLVTLMANEQLLVEANGSDGINRHIVNVTCLLDLPVSPGVEDTFSIFYLIRIANCLVSGNLGALSATDLCSACKFPTPSFSPKCIEFANGYLPSGNYGNLTAVLDRLNTQYDGCKQSGPYAACITAAP
jgi:hypothetical protein